MIEPADLAKIPTAHRHTIALWLTERSRTFRNDRIQLSGLIPAETYRAASDALWGAAADLIDPLSEDSTLSHAHDVLRHAGASMGTDADTPRSHR
jgi:hypothetical protein